MQIAVDEGVNVGIARYGYIENAQRVTSAHNHRVDLNFDCTKAGCGNDGLSKSREV